MEVEENFPRRAGDGRLAAPLNGMTPTTEPAAMDTGITTVSTDGRRDPELQVDRSTRRTTIAVHGAELPSTDTDGSQVTGKRIRQRTTSTTNAAPAGLLCAERPETAFHILRECESVSLVRRERHNFVARQVARICHEKNPGGLVVEEKVYTSPSGVRLKPDIVLEVDEKGVIVDVA
ncbi:hypothetical protein HPB48_013452 [Haemaphysalis longicornis]|uniref:Reverse transcriptase n=1 Tax=Haemaphysalis longicornis TaxID=44386 RepID=A0A9J6GUM8_HAELO|nr:hypothetical protein HPB48_013452 [Haemaphysalis longicornis]